MVWGLEARSGWWLHQKQEGHRPGGHGNWCLSSISVATGLAKYPRTCTFPSTWHGPLLVSVPYRGVSWEGEATSPFASAVSPLGVGWNFGD